VVGLAALELTPCVPNPVIAPHSAEKSGVLASNAQLFPFVPDVARVIPGLHSVLNKCFQPKISVGCGIGFEPGPSGEEYL
jgi:hypothetical protein